MFDVFWRIDKNWQKKTAKSRVFIDEKRFDSDKSDGLRYCYHDLRKEQQLGRSVMIWGGIGYHGKMKNLLQEN